ncbi:MAG TPA: RdgB/HAM1 family non-canonical purine NTP pyrophosphatase [Chitinophagaceae bacterium]|nr:RdgB/HAM1 family non-canonical purine NTP pyrophosphatase [Chitinophagaceae bacterium]
MELVFVTQNSNKIKEIKSLLPSKINLLSIKDIGLGDLDIEETGNSFSENAIIKAMSVFEKRKIPVFAEDSGLVVPALKGAPGIYSARYAGANATDTMNNIKLLEEMLLIQNREAYFTTCIAFIDENSEQYLFEGRCYGSIAKNLTGKDGFGYDPLFIPDSYDKSFAELGESVKNQLSHRSIATKKFIAFLEEHYK